MGTGVKLLIAAGLGAGVCYSSDGCKRKVRSLFRGKKAEGVRVRQYGKGWPTSDRERFNHPKRKAAEAAHHKKHREGGCKSGDFYLKSGKGKRCACFDRKGKLITIPKMTCVTDQKHAVNKAYAEKMFWSGEW